jgi:hypothetical protein
MRISRLALLAIPLLTTTVVAQIPRIGPAVTRWTTTSSATSTGLVAQRILSLGTAAFGRFPSQIELRVIADPVYRGTATLGANVVEFLYDAQTGATVVTARAASFNAVGTSRFALSISENGLVAVCDTSAGPRYATRANVNNAFGPPAPITGVTGTFVDSKIYTRGNQLQYAWVSGNDVMSGLFNSSTGAVTGGTIILNASTTAPISGFPFHSHHPMTRQIPAGSGNWVVLGWLFSINDAANASDTYYLPSADGVTPITNGQAYRVYDTTGWQNNGTFLGSSGTTVVSDNGAGDPWFMPLVAVNNVRLNAATGGVITLRHLVEWSATDVWQTNLCFGAPLGPLPVPFAFGNTLSPGGQTAPAIGQIGLTLNPVVPGISSFGTGNAGGFDYTFTIGGGTIPPGLAIPVQAIGINFTTLRIFTGNTAVIQT